VYPLSNTSELRINVLSDGYLLSIHHYIIKIDLAGNILWSIAYLLEIPSGVVQTADGNYVWIADKIVKVDSTGNIFWSRNLGGFKLLGTNDGGFAMLQSSYDTMQGIKIIKTDSIGNSICNMNDSVFPYSSPTFYGWDPNTIVSSFNYSNLNLPITIFNPVINVESCITLSALKEEIQNNELNFYPNPFHSTAKFRFKSSNMELQNSHLKIYNSMGALMRTEKISDIQSYQIQRESLGDGMYFFQLQKNSGERIGSGNFIID
jgi:hypothetical protein